MVNINKFLLIFVLMFKMASGHAAWERIEVNEYVGKGEAHFFDPDTVQVEGNTAKAWVLSNYDEERVGGYRSVKTLYAFDCKKEKARSQTMLLYPDVMAQGKVVGAYHEKTTEWFSFSSGSIFGQISRVICTN